MRTVLLSVLIASAGCAVGPLPKSRAPKPTPAPPPSAIVQPLVIPPSGPYPVVIPASGALHGPFVDRRVAEYHAGSWRRRGYRAECYHSARFAGWYVRISR